MKVRSIMAVAALAFTASLASAGIGDLAALPEGPNFPRPMPGQVIVPEKRRDLWESIGHWLRPVLGIKRETPGLVPVELD